MFLAKEDYMFNMGFFLVKVEIKKTEKYHSYLFMFFKKGKKKLDWIHYFFYSLK